jgi:hypothetical protein
MTETERIWHAKVPQRTYVVLHVTYCRTYACNCREIIGIWMQDSHRKSIRSNELTLSTERITAELGEVYGQRRIKKPDSNEKGSE